MRSEREGPESCVCVCVWYMDVCGGSEIKPLCLFGLVTGKFAT